MRSLHIRYFGYLIATVAISVTAQADKWGSSVWQASHGDEASVVGVVKMIAHDEERDRFVVRIETESGMETVMVCFEGIQSARNQGNVNLESRNPDLKTMHDSKDYGKRVKVIYGGTWDRCARSVVLEPSKPENNQTAASI